jgi:glycerophosphoryl diester phosphodiesterase
MLALAALALVFLLPALPAVAFDAQGHRGARGLYPENTLIGFEKTLAIGVHTLELDLGMSRDGVVVVSHDAHLSPALTRDRDGAWLEARGPALRTLTLTQIKSYDVGRLKPGSRYQNRFPGQQAVDGTSIPTLGEVFALTKRLGGEHIRFNLETKLRPGGSADYPDPEAFVGAVLKEVRRHGVEARVTLQSFDWRTLQISQRLAPEIPTVYLSAQQRWLDNIGAGQPGPSPWTAGFDIDDADGDIPDLVNKAGGAVWSPYHRELSEAALKRAQALGLKVVVWTVNAPERMRALIDMGVDGIITDYPDRLRDVLSELGKPLPAPLPSHN